jgi:hypothetical protein
MLATTQRLGALARRFLRMRSRKPFRNDDTYLFRSPANAERLMRAYDDSVAGKGQPFTVQQLREEFGLGER